MKRRYLSPLRYPGGKERIAPFLARLIADQREPVEVYAEPFAGGAGAAFALLRDELVNEIALNDLNRGVAAFWKCVLSDTDLLLSRISDCKVSLDEWARQREVYVSGSGSSLDLGFATFFLNRSNHSGILHARPIGGLQQTGKWKMDARFNKEKLSQRIELIAAYADRISVTSVDARTFILQQDRREAKTFYYVDPPYIEQGEELYMNTFALSDHFELADLLRASRSRWLVTYDDDDRVISELYPNNPCGSFTLSHSASRQHMGDEYFVVSQGLRVRSLQGFGPRSANWIREPVRQRSSLTPY